MLPMVPYRSQRSSPPVNYKEAPPLFGGASYRGSASELKDAGTPCTTRATLRSYQRGNSLCRYLNLKEQRLRHETRDLVQI